MYIQAILGLFFMEKTLCCIKLMHMHVCRQEAGGLLCSCQLIQDFNFSAVVGTILTTPRTTTQASSASCSYTKAWSVYILGQSDAYQKGCDVLHDQALRYVPPRLQSSWRPPAYLLPSSEDFNRRPSHRGRQSMETAISEEHFIFTYLVVCADYFEKVITFIQTIRDRGIQVYILPWSKSSRAVSGLRL